jgi:hypothetical protein
MRIVAGTTSATAVQQLTVLVDGAKSYTSVIADGLDVFVNIPAGQHTLTVQAKNSAGQTFSAARAVSVGGSDTPSCASRGIEPVVSICSPLAGSTTGTSIHVASQSVGFTVVSSTAVYVDGKEVYSVSSGTVNTYINAAPGTHYVKVQSQDNSGLTWSSMVRVTSQ